MEIHQIFVEIFQSGRQTHPGLEIKLTPSFQSDSGFDNLHCISQNGPLNRPHGACFSQIPPQFINFTFSVNPNSALLNVTPWHTLWDCCGRRSCWRRCRGGSPRKRTHSSREEAAPASPETVAPSSELSEPR